MQTWAKYALSFFALILILTGFIYAFGPASTREAARSGEMATGQLRADHATVNPGEPATSSGTTQAAEQGAPAGQIPAQPQGPQPLTTTPGSSYSPGDQSGNPSAVNAK